MPGVVINHPKGNDVYKGVKKDYVGEVLRAFMIKDRHPDCRLVIIGPFFSPLGRYTRHVPEGSDWGQNRIVGERDWGRSREVPYRPKKFHPAKLSIFLIFCQNRNNVRENAAYTVVDQKS